MERLHGAVTCRGTTRRTTANAAIRPMTVSGTSSARTSPPANRCAAQRQPPRANARQNCTRCGLLARHATSASWQPVDTCAADVICSQPMDAR
eukprot:5213436-Prymnesium_polylepis.2